MILFCYIMENSQDNEAYENMVIPMPAEWKLTLRKYAKLRGLNLSSLVRMKLEPVVNTARKEMETGSAQAVA
jgi:hypothetical protein